MIKATFWILFLGIALILFVFYPKYNFIKKNPQYCVNVTERFLYCGSQSNAESFYNIKK